jgi:cold shock CspA family protein
VGMTFHRIYGFPLIPGSSLKGLARAYAELVAQASQEEITYVFGDAPGPGEDASTAHVGRAMFFDAMPMVPPKLEIDVMNPHYADYYQGDVPPADYLSPTPIYFLTVGQGNRYLFAVAGLEKTQAREWLEGGLHELGSGAKTTSGYGYWENLAEVEPPVDTIASAPEIAELEIPPGYERGRVKKFGLGPKKSYGFIYRKKDGTEIFVHRDSLAEGVRTLVEDQEVIFKVKNTPKGPQAENVRPLR